MVEIFGVNLVWTALECAIRAGVAVFLMVIAIAMLVYAVGISTEEHGRKQDDGDDAQYLSTLKLNGRNRF